jgi:c-di-GMP-binding flagellar brake protein YcgR
MTWGSDQRKHERRLYRTTARILFSATQVVEVRTTDVSMGGMGIVASANPKNGTTFNIHVLLPVKPEGVMPLEARVEVVHSVLASDEGGFKIGLEFKQLSAAAETALKRFFE